MKRLFSRISLSLLAVLLFVAPVYAMTPSESQTADAACLTTAGTFYGAIFVTDGTNAVTVNIYDNASAASGTKLVPTSFVITTSATDRYRSIGFTPGIYVTKGVYVDVTTSGTVAYTCYYEK